MNPVDGRLYMRGNDIFFLLPAVRLVAKSNDRRRGNER